MRERCMQSTFEGLAYCICVATDYIRPGAAEVRLHNRSEKMLSRLVHGRLRNLK
jgi:hypothetical protein